MDYLNRVKKYVDDSFGEIKPHFERTLYWLLKLEPDADEAMQIAAYGHDIQRAFARKETMERVGNNDDGFLNQEMLNIHQEEGAEILASFLLESGAEFDLVKKVKHLVSKHEYGGDKDQNLIKDADSISYFETNAPKFIEKFVPMVGKEKVKKKFEWMFNRITSKKAQGYAKANYNKSMDILEGL